MNKPAWLLALLAGLLVGGYSLIGMGSAPEPAKLNRASYLSPEALAAGKERRELDSLYSHGRYEEAEEAYLGFVERHEGSSDRDVQDHVGNARIRLGYISTKQKDFREAQTRFEEAQAKYKGLGAVPSDFGGIPDQAAYQAAAALNAEGKRQESVAAFRQFSKDYPLSPLVHGAHKRLRTFGGGKTTPEDDKLLQAAVAKQEARIRFESSVCGPKAIAYLLGLLKLPPKDYKELAKLCGTTDKGTTLEGMRNGLKACGLTTLALRVNRADFAATACPFIWLQGDHYVAVVEIGADFANVYDSLQGGVAAVRLPLADDPDFTADVIAFRPPGSK